MSVGAAAGGGNTSPGSAASRTTPESLSAAAAVVGAGRCGVCGHVGEYVHTEAPTRESHECQACGASLRYRLQASAITAAYARPDAPLAKLLEEAFFRELVIYEPGISGPFRGLLRDLPGYVNSYYWPHVAPGEEHEGVRCEDLRRLTLSDDSVDLVISSDIFEHVRGPMPAFAEIFRVLRPGGYHIFTVPLLWPLPSTTQARVDYSGPDDVFLVPPEYHGSPLDPQGSLVYTDFGMDLPEQLREVGFETATHHGYRNAVTFVSRTPGGALVGSADQGAERRFDPVNATFQEELAALLAQPAKHAPSELFGDVSDDFWLWINTEGYRHSSALRELLPDLPEEQVQRRFTNKTGDDALVEAFDIYCLVRSTYQRHVGEIGDAQDVLDFGCGWGRVIRFFLRDVDHHRLKGADYNGSLVDFCRKSNPWCSFVQNDADPPLTFRDGQFSCVYAYSVFSHFSEAMHLRWLKEFQRILRPGGALVISVRPRHFIEYCGKLRTSGNKVESPILLEMFPETDEELARYDAGEFCYSPYDSSRPDAWWGEACIPRAYIEREWGRLFEVTEFMEATPPFKQHLVLLQA